MAPEPMSSMDASFLHMEDRVRHMHIGGVSIFEGPAPPFAKLEEMVAGKLGLVPRYRQKVRFVPLGLGNPVWVDDPHFRLGYHLRHTAIPTPGTEQQLRKMAARVFSQPLDRDRPLWELWMVEGLDENRWALLSKVHHCMVDGVAATDLMSVMFDDRTEGGGDAPWAPGPEPRGAELVLRTITRRTFDPREQLRSLRDAARRPGESLAAAREIGGAMVAAGRSARPASASSLTGPIGPHRVWSWARVRLTDVKRVRAGLGGTVNDVVLTIVTQGFRDLLESRGEPIEDREVRTMVPVSVRRPGEKGSNRVSGVIASLPIGLTDPRERLQVIRTQMDGLKESKQAVAGDVLVSMSGFAPPMLLALGSRLMSRTPQIGVHTGTTNVPGPQQTVQTLGRRLLESFPFVPVLGPIRVVVAIFSYDGGLYFGVTGDAARRPGESLALARAIGGAMVAAGRSARPASASSLTGPIGPHRVWSWARVRLSDVKRVRADLGGTVNDGVLTIVTQGFRDLLESRGEPVEDREVRTMVPVSVRRPGEKGSNRVSGVIASLPVGLTDPRERLQAIRTQMDGLKESKQAVAG
ncbi:MAG: diacylglycerol O-acyltransferase / wax synthase, partial [Solirubrobacteraceae bacterium]|nr:diacylglycerol O-acyltransferase / wax synthase [Solirubrobacteraceae bacterium]